MSSPNLEEKGVQSAQSGAPTSDNQSVQYRIDDPQMHLQGANESSTSPSAVMDESGTSPGAGVIPTSRTTLSPTMPSSSSGLRSRNRALSNTSDATPATLGLGSAAAAAAGGGVDPSGSHSISQPQGISSSISNVPESDNNTAFERSRPPSDNDKRGGNRSSPENNNNNNINGDGSSSSMSPDGEFAGMGGTPWSQRSFFYQFRPFRGMYHDVKLRLPYYASDWTVAFKPNNLYRVIAASIRMYFVK